MVQSKRKTYDSSAPTLFWHKARERWYFLYHHPRTKDRMWKKTGTADRKEAEKALADHVKLMGAEELGLVETPTSEQAQTTVNQCLDIWAATVIGEELRSPQGALGQMRPLREAFGAHRVTAITLGLINATRTAWRKAGLAKATVNLRIGYLRRACRLAKAHGKILRVPTFPVTSKNGKGDGWPMFDVSDNVREGVVSAEELARVNAAEPEPVIRLFNTFAFWTGMRWGGIASLTWGGFDPQTFTLQLHPKSSKNKKGVSLRLPPGSQLHAVIAQRWAERRDDCKWIFEIGGEPVKASNRWARAWENAGLPMVDGPRSKDHKVPEHIFHDLRRTGLTNLIDSGVREEIAMKISGHRTRSVFQRYVIGAAKDTEQALITVSASVGPVPTFQPIALNAQARGWQERRRVTQRGGRVVQMSAHTRPVPAETPARTAHVGA